MRIAETLRRLIGPLELLHEHAGPRLLQLTRCGVFALWIVKLVLDPLWRLAEMPRELFQPVGILALLSPSALDRLRTPPALFVLLGATMVVSAFAAFGRGFVFLFNATLAAIFLTVYSSLIRSFGPAVHTDIILLLAVYALTGFAWADYFTRKAWTYSSYPLITIAALLTLSYCLVGLNRAVSGGISVFTSDTMESWTVDAGLRGYYFNTGIGWHIPEWPVVVLMLKCGLPFITFFEITAPLCLAVPHYRWVFLPVMLSFHFMSLVLMNIFFFDDMLLYLLLIDWSRHFPSLSDRDRGRPA